MKASEYTLQLDQEERQTLKDSLKGKLESVLESYNVLKTRVEKLERESSNIRCIMSELKKEKDDLTRNIEFIEKSKDVVQIYSLEHLEDIFKNLNIEILKNTIKRFPKYDDIYSEKREYHKWYSIEIKIDNNNNHYTMYSPGYHYEDFYLISCNKNNVKYVEKLLNKKLCTIRLSTHGIVICGEKIKA